MWLLILIPIFILLFIRAIIIIVYDEIVKHRENKDWDYKKKNAIKDAKARIIKANRLEELNKEKSIKEE